MLKFLIVFSLVIVNGWSFNFHKSSRGRMIGGELATAGQFPYTAYLADNEGSYICGGALIDKNWILTAAHCVDDLQYVMILLGVTNIFSDDETTEMIISEEIIIHPDWNEATRANDIGLLKIPDVHYTVNIFPVPLPTDVNYVAIGNAQLSSWGGLEGSLLPQRLQWSTLRIISKEECSLVCHAPTDDMLCAYPNPNVKATAGDSGSPLVLEDTLTLVGILASSWDQDLTPVVFTRVSHFLDWIRICTGITVHSI